MNTKTVPIFFYRNLEYGYEQLSSCDMATMRPGEYVTLGTGQCEIHLRTDREQVKAAVAALEIAKKKEMADSQVRLNKLDEQIQNLLAITHQG